MVAVEDIQLGNGLYGGVEIDRYVALYTDAPLRSRARSWLRHLLSQPDHAPGRPDFSFYDLISAFSVAQLRDRGVSFPRVRQAYDKLSEIVGADRPLAYRGLHTDGVYVYADLGVRGQLTNLNTDAQEANRAALELNLAHVQFETGSRYADRVAVSWAPMEGISVHPHVMFGAPCIGNHRITTESVAGMVADGFGLELIESDYGLTGLEIRQALAFENRLATLSV